MKFVNLRGPAYVNGGLRKPNEGTLHLEDDEAARLIDNGLADDVTADFPEVANEETPTEAVTADTSKGKGKA